MHVGPYCAYWMVPYANGTVNNTDECLFKQNSGQHVASRGRHAYRGKNAVASKFYSIETILRYGG